MAEGQIGLLHEIGDLGLGFTELSDKDKKTIEENDKTKNDKDKE